MVDGTGMLHHRMNQFNQFGFCYRFHHKTLQSTNLDAAHPLFAFQRRPHND